MSNKERERIGRLIVDRDISDEDRSKLVFALGRDTPFHAEIKTSMRIDVYRFVGTSICWYG